MKGPKIFWNEFKSLKIETIIQEIAQEFKQLPKDIKNREIAIINGEIRTLNIEHLYLGWYLRYIIHGI